MTAASPWAVATSVGTAQVLHRLALAVECVDGVTEDRTVYPVRVGREVPARVAGAAFDPAWPALALEPDGPARSLLRHHAALPNTVTVRLADPAGRHVPRRLRIPLWTLGEVAANDLDPTRPRVPARSRLVRCWLLPGSAHPLPPGVPALRGTVTRAGRGVRWARITAVELLPGGSVGTAVGWAHADGRGEYLMPLTIPDPTVPTMVRLRVVAPQPVSVPVPSGEPDPDPLHDLVIEDVTRSGATPLPVDLDNPLLRGRTVPLGYRSSAGPPVEVRVPTGAAGGDEIRTDIPFRL